MNWEQAFQPLLSEGLSIHNSICKGRQGEVNLLLQRGALWKQGPCLIPSSLSLFSLFFCSPGLWAPAKPVLEGPASFLPPGCGLLDAQCKAPSDQWFLPTPDVPHITAPSQKSLFPLFKSLKFFCILVWISVWYFPLWTLSQAARNLLLREDHVGSEETHVHCQTVRHRQWACFKHCSWN